MLEIFHGWVRREISGQVQPVSAEARGVGGRRGEFSRMVETVGAGSGCGNSIMQLYNPKKIM